MASITRCGTCVPPGPSRNTAGCPATVCASEGNCARTQARSSPVDLDIDIDEEVAVCSAVSIADILIERAAADGTGRASGDPFRWTIQLAFAFVGGVQSNTRGPGRFVDQIVSRLRSFSSHHRACG